MLESSEKPPQSVDHCHPENTLTWAVNQHTFTFPYFQDGWIPRVSMPKEESGRPWHVYDLASEVTLVSLPTTCQGNRKFSSSSKREDTDPYHSMERVPSYCKTSWWPGDILWQPSLENIICHNKAGFPKAKQTYTINELNKWCQQHPN